MEELKSVTLWVAASLSSHETEVVQSIFSRILSGEDLHLLRDFPQINGSPLSLLLQERVCFIKKRLLKIVNIVKEKYLKELMMHHWALKKWQWIVDEWNDEIDYNMNVFHMLIDLKELKKFDGYCAYCNFLIEIEAASCKMCPLGRVGQVCGCFSYYGQWNYFVGEGNKEMDKIAHFYADMLRDMIRAIKEFTEYRIVNEIIKELR